MTPEQLAAIRNLTDIWDCGDNSCKYDGQRKGGMRTNGGCRCERGAKDALADLLDEVDHLTRRYNSYVKATEEIESNLADVIKSQREEIAYLKRSSAQGGRIFKDEWYDPIVLSKDR